MEQRASRGRDDYQDYRSSLGAHVAGWMGGNPLQTPAAKFAQIFLLRLRPVDRVSIHIALQQFVKIDGQGWAVEMLAALDHEARENSVLTDNGEGFDPEVAF